MEINMAVLESKTPHEQALLFANSDLVVGPHGAGFTNIIYMTPKSYLYELFQPNFNHKGYRYLAKCTGIGYSCRHTNGPLLPSCIKNLSIQCNIDLRYSNFSLNPELVIEDISMLLPKIWRKYYFSV